ncbi:MAG: 16S rRNA (uracil(1498)-N(3))-methyltransferase [Microbacteriaceae bacterium]|nr:16S rRNA (uracil(1498)-N(3))-methyltransferase [Microbacteriaceae bacterium]
MANLYFTDTPLDEATVRVELTGDEARHAVQVARIRVGERFRVSDGRGWSADAVVVSADKSVVACDVEQVRFEPVPSTRLVLAQALAKGDRDEMAIQMATELGVDTVIPWQSERSVSRWAGDKVAKGVARWTAIVREASKQAMRSRIPRVTDPVSTATVCGSQPGANWIVLDPRATSSLTEWFTSAGNPAAIGVIVGPEGGITEDEIARFVADGATPVRLDGPILRTSTAGPAAIAAILALSGTW